MDPQSGEANASGKTSMADGGAAARRRGLLKEAVVAGGLALALVAAVLAFGYVHYGDIPSFLAALRGDDVSVDVQTLPEQTDGLSRRLAFNIRVRNLTTRSFRVLGINDNCDCLSVEGIPAAVGARESIDITVKLRVAPDQPAAANVMLITDDAQLSQIRVSLH
jgi:hypothetical protein